MPQRKYFGVQPDLITCAKGLTSGYIPMGAVIISDEVMANCADPDEAVLFSNGFTYSGHPVAAAAALKNMEIFEREGILENVLDVSPHFQERLGALSKYEIVGDARGMGLLGCIEGKAEDLEAERRLGQMIDDACEDLGLVVRPLINMAVFSPPLIITHAQVDDLFDILEEALTRVERDVLGA